MPASTRSFQAPVGTFDVLPPESGRYESLVADFAATVGGAGYGLVLSPMFEDVAVFQRVGDATDIVRKEMYCFDDRGGRSLALRPEGTASIVRAFVQHRPVPPWKVWYVGPNFRYDRPQAGRYRQHHQVGVEALGVDDPDLDTEVIALAADYLAAVGLRRWELIINSMGDSACRPGYVEELRAFLAARCDDLCDDHRAHFEHNPLRVLDCKKAGCRAVTADAPMMVEHLCEPCRSHFERVRTGLAGLKVDTRIDPRLVRGQDYYTRTTFEFIGDALAPAEQALGGGGRYDGLAEALGGPPTPGIGFGMGLERMLLAADAEGAIEASDARLDAFLIDSTPGTEGVLLLHELRRAGLRVDRAYGGRSLKAQFRLADRSGAPIALVLGPDELQRGVVGCKALRGDGTQSEVPLHGLAEALRHEEHETT